MNDIPEDDNGQQLLDDERRYSEWEERMEWLEQHRKARELPETEDEHQ